MLENNGPFTNLNSLFSPRISEPIMSEGIKSGVNWILLNPRPRLSAIVFTSRVLASPGTPTKRQCPLLKIPISTFLMVSSCPTITFPISWVKALYLLLNASRASLSELKFTY